jgi:hypothetical protein
MLKESSLPSRQRRACVWRDAQCPAETQASRRLWRGGRGHGGSTSGARSRPCSRIAVTLFAVGLPLRSARTHAASTRSRPYLSASRITPRHVLYSASGCVRRLMTARELADVRADRLGSRDHPLWRPLAIVAMHECSVIAGRISLRGIPQPRLEQDAVLVARCPGRSSRYPRKAQSALISSDGRQTHTHRHGQ